MLGLLPWLDPALAVAGLPVALCLVRWTLARAPAARRADHGGAAARLARVLRAAQRDAVRRPAAVGRRAPRRRQDAAAIAERAPNLLGLWLDPVGGAAALGAGARARASSARGCCCARGASTSRPRSRRGARPSASPSCWWPRSPRSGWSPPSPSTAPTGEWFPGLPLFAAVPGHGRAGGVGPAPRARRRRRARRRHARAQRVGARRRVDAAPPEGWLGASR